MSIIKEISIVCLFFLTAATSTEAGLSKQEVCTLYNQANETFRQANSTKGTDQAQRLYEKAILSFEKIIEEAFKIRAERDPGNVPAD